MGIQLVKEPPKNEVQKSFRQQTLDNVINMLSLAKKSLFHKVSTPEKLFAS